MTEVEAGGQIPFYFSFFKISYFFSEAGKRPQTYFFHTCHFMQQLMTERGK